MMQFVAYAERPGRWAGKSNDYDGLLEFIGDARFVLLGEASHGTHEFYRERAQITKRLIVEKGFNAVAIEADWADAYRVNRYFYADLPAQFDAILHFDETRAIEPLEPSAEWSRTQEPPGTFPSGVGLVKLLRKVRNPVDTFLKVRTQAYDRLRSNIPAASPAREAIEKATRIDHSVEGVLFAGYSIPCNEQQLRIIREIAARCCPEIVPDVEKALARTQGTG